MNPIPENCIIAKKLARTLEVCEKIAHLCGEPKFGNPLDEPAMTAWEQANGMQLHEEVRAWLAFADGAVFKGLPMILYPLDQFAIHSDFVLIGTFGDDELRLDGNGRIFRHRGEKKQNMGFLSTLLRTWTYDAGELLAEEELAALQPVIAAEEQKLALALQRANAEGAGIREAMEVFFARDNLAYLKFWRTYPKCPVPPKQRDCELIIAEPDYEGYYQWQPKPFAETVDFSELEQELGFAVHPDLKALLTSFYFFHMDGQDCRDPEHPLFHDMRIYGVLPHMNFRSKVIGGFDKSGAYFRDDFICEGHFCQIGSEGENSLEFDNDTGAVYSWDYEGYSHEKIADSLFALLMAADSIWANAEHSLHSEYFLK